MDKIYARTGAAVSGLKGVTTIPEEIGLRPTASSVIVRSNALSIPRAIVSDRADAFDYTRRASLDVLIPNMDTESVPRKVV
ncbi:MAG TPA: hypothetical protein VIH90_00085 [Candidatus Saccharimonadales bacterium]